MYSLSFSLRLVRASDAEDWERADAGGGCGEKGVGFVDGMDGVVVVGTA